MFGKLKWLFALMIICDSLWATCTGLGCTCAVSATGVAFGVYNQSSNLDSSGTVTVTCSAQAVGAVVSYEIQLSKGNSGSYAARKLLSGGNQLNYNLYTNAGRTQVWGDGTASTSVVTDGYTMIGLLNALNYTVYGQIPGSQSVPSGAYSDSIIATVIF